MLERALCCWAISFLLVGCAGAGNSSPIGNTLGSGGDDSSSGTSDPSGGSGSSSAGSATSTSGSSGEDPTTPTASITSTTGPGDSSTTDEPTTTTGDPISWSRYSFDVADQAWTRVSLEDLWAHPNAPPSTGISGAVSLTRFDRTIVVTEDGGVYEQVAGTWQAPSTLATRFPEAAGLNIASLLHTPGQGKDGENHEDIFLVDNPTASIYVMQSNGALMHIDNVAQMDEKGAAPQGTQRMRWGIAVTDPSLIGMDADWHVWHMAFDNDELWRFNAAFEWVDSPLNDNEFFTGSPAEPNPASVRAAYYDDAFDVAHFIAP